MVWRTGFLLGAGLLCATALASPQVGFRQFNLTNDVPERALNVVVLYPAAQSEIPVKSVGDNSAFVGVAVQENAQPAHGMHPFIALSHGFGGNWRNQLWLAHALAQQGYIVAATDHPGTTSMMMNKAIAAKLWLRPDDVRRVISAIQNKQNVVGTIASGKMAVIGHSLGGWTAMELAGGRFDTQQFETDCQTHTELASCIVYQKMGIPQEAQANTLLGQPARDARVTAVVSLDLGLARGFTSQSLSAINIPVLVISAGQPDPQLPATLESYSMAQKMPQRQTHYLEVNDASHFSFMQLCKPGAIELLEHEQPGEGIICVDGNKRSREQIHHQIIATISDFLNKAWH
ncbi:alpha/beta hydrolase [Candidatus Symbiopectobacterium sp. NZEC127]|uniref:alpha/beta hydrolase family protein n=1 Tax=Candidatus Symbiopectobacterium sp. NZEC127 TaxID=2820472 RepID=UPI00222637D4|nr:alpha/beta fold hydrolase [Candidatus Symbiopectobacterium sp. NZEC127]MCW2486858.1 alpha/beta hydrolase [Candidatus Symbiopectobacterium sp. NZEC127]